MQLIQFETKIILTKTIKHLMVLSKSKPQPMTKICQLICQNFENKSNEIFVVLH